MDGMSLALNLTERGKCHKRKRNRIAFAGSNKTKNYERNEIENQRLLNTDASYLQSCCSPKKGVSSRDGVADLNRVCMLNITFGSARRRRLEILIREQRARELDFVRCRQKKEVALGRSTDPGQQKYVTKRKNATNV